MEDELDEIYEYADENREEPVNQKYYLATIFKPSKYENILLTELIIDIAIFFKFPFPLVYRYAYPYTDYQGIHFTNRIEIVQLRILNGGYYAAIIKTFWLREFQRKWKKIYKDRKEWIESVRKNPMKFLDRIQRTGSFVKCH
jgi:hypothetical protein